MIEISIIIPCLNEKNYIQECIGSIIENGFSTEDIEILVVDGASNDGTIVLLEQLQYKYNCIKIIQNPAKKTPFALNLGVQNASGKYILIAGAHAFYPKGYISALYHHIQTPGIDVVGGALETCVKIDNDKTRAIKFVLSHPMGVGNSLFRTGADKMVQVDTVPFGLYKKEIFENVGLYNERLIRNHDIELSRRIQAMGYKIWLDPSFKVKYYARETFAGLARNNYGNGFWNLKTIFITRRFKSLSIRHYIPLLFIFSIIMPLLMGVVFHTCFYLLSIFCLLVYFTTLKIVIIKNLKKLSFIHLWAFVILHFSYGWGSLMGLFSSIFSGGK